MRLERVAVAGTAMGVALGVFGGLALRPVDARDRTGYSAGRQTAAAPTLKVYSRETFVDVTVTDAQGRPVHGLTRDDFTVLEDGAKMEPNSFTEHRMDTPVDAAEPVKEKLPANTFSNVDPTHSDGPINILLLDSSNTPVMNQHIVQTQMLDFVNKMRPGTRAAVLRMTYHLSIVQGITTDRDLIRAALASDRITPGDFAEEDALQDSAHLDDPPGVVPDASDVHELKADDGSRIDGDHACDRGQYVEVAMKQLARFLEGMPGRKNLLWFTGFAPCVDATSEADLLARAHVTIYPIDPRGPRTRSRFAAVEKRAMAEIAAQTGGTFFEGGDATTVARIIDGASNYYTLTYVPTDKAATSGNFRHITVKVDRPSAKLTYRPGYYATDPAKSLSGMKLIPQATAMQAAMERGGLEPTQILFHVKVDQGATDGAVSAGNRVDPKAMKSPFRHLAVTYTIDIGSMAFDRGGDGKYRANFEFGVMVYDADGKLVNTVSKQVRPVVTAAAYQSMLKDGAVAHEVIDVPAHGEYFLRVGVHDLANDKVGALEVPTSDIADLGAQRR